MQDFIQEYARYQIENIHRQNIPQDKKARLIKKINSACNMYTTGYYRTDELMCIISETYYDYYDYI